jgi:UTP:GlnB (protein PII) uridylyltransferase
MTVVEIVALNEMAISRLRVAAVARGLDGDRVAALAKASPPLWGGSTDQRLDDLVLLLRPLEVGEVRVRVQVSVQEPVNSDDANQWDVSLVAQDRVGLLSITSSLLAQNELSITQARVATWPDGTALQHLRVHSNSRSSIEPAWASIGQNLRNAIDSAKPTPGPGVFSEAWIRDVQVLSKLPDGQRLLVIVDTDDCIGILAAVAYAFSALGANVVSAEIQTIEGAARDLFVVDAPPASVARIMAMNGSRQELL